MCTFISVVVNHMKETQLMKSDLEGTITKLMMKRCTDSAMYARAFLKHFGSESRYFLEKVSITHTDETDSKTVREKNTV